jgi:hypothetical protein
VISRSMNPEGDGSKMVSGDKERCGSDSKEIILEKGIGGHRHAATDGKPNRRS